MFVAAPLRADYVVTRIDGTSLKTHSYWIQGRNLHFSEGRAPIDPYSVKNVIEKDLTPGQAAEHKAAMEAFEDLALTLLATETDLAVAQAQTLARLSEFPLGDRKALSRKEKKALTADLNARRQKVAALLADWENMKLPDFSLINARDIKGLQLLALDASLEQAVKYVDKRDPTCFEYARANLGQYAAFEDTFQDAASWK
jgi:hypothetical protein